MDNNTQDISGGCLCGTVRFRSSRPPLSGAFCHCHACQKNYGGLFMASLQFDGAGFEFVKGVPKYFRSSVAGRRAFCEECGSPILFKYEANMDVWVLLGALDEPGRWPMTSDATWGKTVHFHVNNKNPWEVISPGLRQLTTETPFRDEGEQLAASGAR